MTSSVQLEQEAQRARAQVEQTLEELRNRMTPGGVVDQLVDYARDSTGGQFFHNLRQQVAENPLPVAVIGAGLIWMMISKRRGDGRWTASSAGSNDIGAPLPQATGDRTSDSVKSAAGSAGEAGSDLGQKTMGVISDLGETAGRVGSRVEGTITGAASAVGQAASSAYEQTTSGASRFASSLRSNASTAGRGLRDLFEEQPLVLAALGLAIGAAIGAAFPPTETEDRLMGKKSEDIKEDVEAFVHEEYESDEASEPAFDRAREAGGVTSNSGTHEFGGRGEQRPEDTSIVPSGEEKLEDTDKAETRAPESVRGAQ